MKLTKRALITALILPALTSSAQVYNILHPFNTLNHDGTNPRTELVQDGNFLNGATVSGGTNFNGIFFRINSDGTGYTNIFTITNSPVIQGKMVLIGDSLYGTAFTGGANNNGSIFKITTNGTGFTELHSFAATVSPPLFGTNNDGNRPPNGLVTDGTTLYGTTQYGGTNGNGTIFRINADGSDFAVIKTFSATYSGTNDTSGNTLKFSGTNLDGAYPLGLLVLDGGTLYGTTYHGGISNGVVFSVETNGDNFTVLKYFPPIIGAGLGTNVDGAAPIAGLTLSGDTLYGMAVGGGVAGVGNIFTLKTNGSAFANIHDFLGPDGIFPRNSLLIDGATLYGSTQAGGISNNGTIFMVLTNGGDFTILKQLVNASGYQCLAKFLLSSNILFGTASSGGPNNGGVLFALTVLPHIMNDTNFGIRSGLFGFDYNGISNQTAIIESTTNLSQANWQPLQTNLLNGTPLYFDGPASNQNPTRFYRIHSP